MAMSVRGTGLESRLDRRRPPSDLEPVRWLDSVQPISPDEAAAPDCPGSPRQGFETRVPDERSNPARNSRKQGNPRSSVTDQADVVYRKSVGHGQEQHPEVFQRSDDAENKSNGMGTGSRAFGINVAGEHSLFVSPRESAHGAICAICQTSPGVARPIDVPPVLCTRSPRRLEPSIRTATRCSMEVLDQAGAIAGTSR